MTLQLQAGNRQLDLSVPVCMGIINVTPDSFSDGSRLAKAGSAGFRVDLDKTLKLADQMVGSGAAILDVGGESTRPGAATVSTEEELERVLPVVEALLDRFDVCVSVDTSSARLMTEAIAAGVHLVNDVRALALPGALEAVANSSVACCLMHMRGSPDSMQDNTAYDDVVEEVLAFLKQRVASCNTHGINNERMLLDPGFGFGKSPQQNYLLLRELGRFVELGIPVLVGLSRKSMIEAATGRPVEQRLAGSIAAATLALQAGARIIRSHDVAATMDAIGVHCAYQNA